MVFTQNFPIERLVVLGPAGGNLVLSFSLSSSGCSDHCGPGGTSGAHTTC